MPNPEWTINVLPDAFLRYLTNADRERNVDDKVSRNSPEADADPALNLPADKNETSCLTIANPLKIDLHLSYSYGLENGPVIQRRGDSPPKMNDPLKPVSPTYDPDRQRVGSYYVTREKKIADLADLSKKFAAGFTLWKKIEARNKEKLAWVKCADLMARYGVKFKQPYEFFDRPVSQFDALHEEVASFIVGLSAFGSMDPDDKVYEDLMRESKKYSENVSKSINQMFPAFVSVDQSNSIIGSFDILQQDPIFHQQVETATLKYLLLLIQSLRTRIHEEVAKSTCKTPVVFMQGCGDLTMNMWNVAFVRGMSLSPKSGDKWSLLHAPDEKLNDREYSCLIKWNDEGGHVPESLRAFASSKDKRVVWPYQIAKLTFHAPSPNGGENENDHVFLDGEPIGDLVEFAVSGRQLLQGNPVPLRGLIRELSDIRHALKLPDLNPDILPRTGLPSNIRGYLAKPRYLFNQSSHDSVWLGEKYLIQGDPNIKFMALDSQILIDIKELGAPWEWINWVLKNPQKFHWPYIKAVGNADEELKPGEWRWRTEGAELWLEIRLRENQYPCSMIGVTAHDENEGSVIKSGVTPTHELYFFAHGHSYTYRGSTITEAAEFLHSRNVKNAIMFDEGQDVFQVIRHSDGTSSDFGVPSSRKQIRCVFWGNEKQFHAPC